MSHSVPRFLLVMVGSSVPSYVLTRRSAVSTPAGRGSLDSRPILPFKARFPNVGLPDSLLATAPISLCLVVMVLVLANTPFVR